MIADSKILIFAGSGGELLAKRMCKYMGMELSPSQGSKFSDGNTFVRVNESVRDRNVYIVQPIGNHPNDEFVEVLFYADALVRSSALSVTHVMPYFGYAKGDKKDEPRVSIRARVCAESMELAGCDRFITMDLHSPQVQGFFKKPMDHLYAMPMLCEYAKRHYELSNTVIVSPDAGFAKQARKYAEWLDLPVAIGDKERKDHTENANILDILGDVEGKNALIVDDFSTSGGTLNNVALGLKHKGAKTVRAMLSHNIVSVEGVELLDKGEIEEIVSTDSLFNPNVTGHEKFKTVSMAPVFGETITRFHKCESINTMFTELSDSIVRAGIELAKFTKEDLEFIRKKVPKTK